MKSLPRLKIAHLPTAVEALPRLSSELSGPMILVKRDDQTGLALGGNKTRKLEFLMAEAQANGARTVISAGAVQSNHCRQTAAAAARFGFDCILVLNLPPEKDVSPQAMMQPNGNLLLDLLLGAEIVWTEKDAREHDLKAIFQKAWDEGRRPYMIPYGGSSPTGALGYVYAMQELLNQKVFPDTLIIPSSSAGTHAGLMLGARLFGYTGKILGISIDEPAEELKAHVAQLATRTADLLGERFVFTSEEIHVNDDYLGSGYGVMGKSEVEAIKMFASKEGLLLDPVYTARAAAGLIDLIRKGFFEPSQKVLFWHTGGAPALFADRYRGMI
jgi:D-cysteine desulfhydrase family pyridoxal phosphate-dependent enzyme